MNKKFTMVCASLLLASAFSVNAQTYSQSANPNQIVAVAYDAVTKINLAEGVKFYLKGSASYYSVKEVTLADGKTKVWTLGQEVALANAAVFEVRSFSKIGGGASFELYVDGNKIVVDAANGGSAADVAAKDIASKLYVEGTTTNFADIKVFKVNGVGAPFAGSTVKAYTAKLEYNHKNLNDYNANSTTFSFDFTDDELVGNEFKEVIPVTITDGSVEKTYFLKGKNANQFNPANTATFKGLSMLAVNPNHRYGLNTGNKGEGYALYWMNAEKALKENETSGALELVSDSLSIAAFTKVVENDVLNKEGVLELAVMPNPTINDSKVFNGAELNIQGVKVSTTDTKAYVTTVTDNTTWATRKNAQLGSNTYFSASEFLKADAMNTVSILIVNGKQGAGRYYNYVTVEGDNPGNAVIAYKPNSELDFSMAHNQWVVTGFNGKYELTLTNRLATGKKVVLQLKKVDAGYEITNPLNAGISLTANDAVDGKIPNPVVKFLSITTTATDGYLRLSDKQIEEGLKLTFTGETPLAGEKEFYGVIEKRNYGSGVESYFVPSLKSDNWATFKPLAEIDKDGKDKVVAQTLSYACLNSSGEVVSKEVKSNLVVPTYKLAYGELNEDGSAKQALTTGRNGLLIADYTNGQGTSFAFAKNMNGGYSLVPMAETEIDIKNVAQVGTIGVFSSSSEYFDFVTDISRYYKDGVNEHFANVNIHSGVELNPTLPAQSGHFTFNNVRGSIAITDVKGINEGVIASEGLTFWLDSADTELETPSFYISRAIEGETASRMYMFNPIDSAKIFNENTADFDYNDVYYYGEDHRLTNELKVAFTPAVIEEGKDLADQFKFNITLKDKDVSDEYVISTVKPVYAWDSDAADYKDCKMYVSQRNGVMLLTQYKDNAMAFTVNPAEAPTSDESVVASEVKVVANNGSVVVKNAAGKNVVVSTILGQVVANEVLTSDNATINVPAGIVVVAVDGESFKVNVK